MKHTKNSVAKIALESILKPSSINSFFFITGATTRPQRDRLKIFNNKKPGNY